MSADWHRDLAVGARSTRQSSGTVSFWLRQLGVLSRNAEWWARQDSNLRQHRYERRVLTS
jgi:hypothetical protein